MPRALRPCLDQVGDRRFPGAGQAGEPQHGRPMVHELRPLGLAHGQMLQVHVGGAAQCEIDHAGGDRLVGEAIDQNERAGLAVLGVRIERQRPRNGHVANADLVELERLRGKLRQGVDVEPVVEIGNGCRHGRVIDLHQIGAPGQQLVVGHPDQVSGELVGDLRTVAHGRQHVATRDIDLVGERDGDRISRLGTVEFAAGTDDRPDLRTPPGGERGNLVAGPGAAADDRAGKTAEIEVRPVDPLDRHAERTPGAIVSGVDGFQMFEQMTPGIPRRATAARADVVAVAGGDRDGLDVLEAKWRGKVQEAVRDPVENGAVEADQIDLVHRQDGVANAQEADDDGVTPRLGEKALARIDQKHCQFGRGRAGRHVAGILLVARGVGDNERPPSGREISIGDVDGDALFALGFQPVEQQGKIDLRSAGAVFPESRSSAAR